MTYNEEQFRQAFEQTVDEAQTVVRKRAQPGIVDLTGEENIFPDGSGGYFLMNEKTQALEKMPFLGQVHYFGDGRAFVRDEATGRTADCVPA